VQRKLRKRHVVIAAFLLLWAGTAWWHSSKPLPAGLHITGAWQTIDAKSLSFLTDQTFADNYGQLSAQQSIHRTTIDLIHKAQDFLILDYFLFNSQGGPAGPLRYDGLLRPVAIEMREALRELRAAQPNIPILLLIDPINDYYRGTAPAELAALEQLGINVVVVKLDVLRDSNPIYSGLWRLLAGWWLRPGVNGRWDNPLDAAGPALTLGALTRIPHFKANHRKLVLTGDGAGSIRGIISSANPHDASSAHSNVAAQLQGEFLRPLLRSELAIARFSGWRGEAAQFDRADVAAAQTAPTATKSPADTRAAVITEGAIREQLLTALTNTAANDSIDLALFYLTDRAIVDSLLAAAARGVTIRIVLDPNKDAFGFEKSGLPNRQVASELITGSDGAIHLRWYRTHGEQFHSKFAAVRRGQQLWFTLGSANYTRRNLGDYNLEANVMVETPNDSPLAQQINVWFEALWSNRPGSTEYTADAEVYAEPSQTRYWLYRLAEATGLSTF
jgi:phosphatidylserine/phosphatidylglycerophosphate/cardiolipin synthase-like enzyme